MVRAPRSRSGVQAGVGFTLSVQRDVPATGVPGWARFLRSYLTLDGGSGRQEFMIMDVGSASELEGHEALVRAAIDDMQVSLSGLGSGWPLQVHSDHLDLPSAIGWRALNLADTAHAQFTTAWWGGNDVWTRLAKRADRCVVECRAVGIVELLNDHFDDMLVTWAGEWIDEWPDSDTPTGVADLDVVPEALLDASDRNAKALQQARVALRLACGRADLLITPPIHVHSAALSVWEMLDDPGTVQCFEAAGDDYQLLGHRYDRIWDHALERHFQIPETIIDWRRLQFPDSSAPDAGGAG